MIQLDDAPVVREPILANPNLGAMKDETENALPKCSKVLGDVAMELVCLLAFILRSVDQANEFLALCRDFLGLILLQSRDSVEEMDVIWLSMNFKIALIDLSNASTPR